MRVRYCCKVIYVLHRHNQGGRGSGDRKSYHQRHQEQIQKWRRKKIAVSWSEIKELATQDGHLVSRRWGHYTIPKRASEPAESWGKNWCPDLQAVPLAASSRVAGARQCGQSSRPIFRLAFLTPWWRVSFQCEYPPEFVTSTCTRRRTITQTHAQSLGHVPLHTNDTSSELIAPFFRIEKNSQTM